MLKKKKESRDKMEVEIDGNTVWYVCIPFSYIKWGLTIVSNGHTTKSI